MATETLPTRTQARTGESVPFGFAGALGLHLLIVAIAVGYVLVERHRNPHWGDTDPIAGSIQASMVNSIPLPPKLKPVDKEVLASDKLSVAPTPPPPAPVIAKTTPLPPKAEVAPRKDDVLIPAKVPPRVEKTAEKPVPEAPRRPPAAPPAPTPKATTGETAAVQVPFGVTPLKNGTASFTVEERSFGERYAYYIRTISTKVNQSWSEEALDPRSSVGKKTTVTFTIGRDGTPSDVHVTSRSGAGVFDSSAQRAIERIETFGPLPQGDHITIAFSFDFRQQ